MKTAMNLQNSPRVTGTFFTRCYMFLQDSLSDDDSGKKHALPGIFRDSFIKPGKGPISSPTNAI